MVNQPSEGVDEDLASLASLLLGFDLPTECLAGVRATLSELMGHAQALRGFTPPRDQE